MIARSAIGKYIASGGSKIIYDLRNGNVIALPTKARPTLWQQIVEHEIKNAAHCKSIGLLTQDYRYIYVNNESAELLPALVMPSFETLAKKGFEIRDHKMPYLANCGTTMLFGKLENLTSSAYLKQLLKQLIPDIVTAIVHQINADSDTINLVITGQPNHDGIIDFQQQKLRLYFYDFSNESKHELINEAGHINRSKLRALAQYYLHRAYYCIGSALLPSEEKQMGILICHVDEFLSHSFNTIKEKLEQHVTESVINQLSTKQHHEVPRMNPFRFFKTPNNDAEPTHTQTNFSPAI